ncbi:MAG: 3-isopropylmalate dehydratase large subunit [Candidatus Woesearchaeota archaeon]
MAGKSLYEKVIEMHTVIDNQIVIGRKVIHEVTSNPACIERLRDDGLDIVYPETAFAVMDHIINTRCCSGMPFKDSTDELMAKTLEQNVKDFNVTYFPPGSGKGGVCHVVFPEQGIIWPGMTAICGDSHTSTYGALGAIGFGVGSTQLGHALGSQTIYLDQKLKKRKINFVGTLQKGVTAKDLIMLAIREVGAKGGNGYAHEYAGEVIERMSMEGRFTMCNMGVEGGAKVAYINPDEITFNYLKGKPYAPKQDWDKAVEFWKSIASDKDAEYDDVRTIDVTGLEPMVSWGTASDESVMINEKMPYDKKGLGHTSFENALGSYAYMGLVPGRKIAGTPVDVVFIGSCTNGRLSDIEYAVEILEGKKVAVKTIVVPGSELVKQEAERLGYDKILIDAGAEWRNSGCSMCLSMSPDTLVNQERTASTSNRNFMNRQGKGAKTHLMSPYTAAATALEGVIADPRKYL